MRQPLTATISGAANRALSLSSSYIGARARWRTLDPAALQAFQETRARHIVAHAAAHSPFYRRHWHGRQLDRWRTLPTVDKGLMMANFAEFNTRGVTAEAAMSVALAAERTRDFAPTVGDLTVGLSSGTSGHRGIFVVSPAEQAMWAGVILARALHTLRAGRTRVAFFLRSHSNLYQQVDGMLLQLRYFDLMSPLPESIAALNRYQPHILVGPPSLLGFLAAAQARDLLSIRPHRLISVAEVLEPQDEAVLAATFQVPVHQVYQCTEGLLAVSCPHGSLHLQEDIVAVQCEPLDSTLGPQASPTYSSAPASSPAWHASPRRITPIVTDLWRRTQPIIRYRLNDVLQLADKPCPCGSCFRTITHVEGRRDDVCYFFARSGSAAGPRRPFFPDTIRRMILLAAGDIDDYQAVQASDGQLLVHLALPPGVPQQGVIDAVRTSVYTTLEQYGCVRPQLDVDARLPPPLPGQKRRRVQRL